MNVNDILIRVKRNFGDESGVQITDADIIRWINDGQRQIVLSNEGLLEKVTTADTVAEQQEYTLPVDILILKHVTLKDQGQESYFRLRPLNLNDFNSYIDGWDGSTFTRGLPTVYTIFAEKIILFPVPDFGVTDGLKIYYNRKPVVVADGLDTPDLPELYHESLVKHCLSMAYELDEDWDAAAVKGQDRDADISLLRGRDDWKQQGTYPLISVRPEDGW